MSKNSLFCQLNYPENDKCEEGVEWSSEREGMWPLAGQMKDVYKAQWMPREGMKEAHSWPENLSFPVGLWNIILCQSHFNT